MKIARYKRKLSRYCYFRKIDGIDKVKVLRGFRKEALENKDQSVAVLYEKHRRDVKENYGINSFKLISFISSILGVFFSLIMIASVYMMHKHWEVVSDSEIYYFIDDASIILSLYVFAPFSALCTFVGMLIGKIKIRNYKYNWILLFVQVALIIIFFCYGLYMIGEAMSGF